MVCRSTDCFGKILKNDLNLLQDIYLKDRSERSFNCFYTSVLKAAKSVVYKLITRSHKSTDLLYIEEAAYDATSRLLIRYTTNCSYRSTNVLGSIYWECRFILHDKRHKSSNRYWAEHNKEWHDGLNLIAKPVKSKESTDHVLLDIIAGHPSWKQVFLDVYKSSSYKRFILTLSTYSPKQWIYDYAARLKLLYKYTRMSQKRGAYGRIIKKGSAQRKDT